MTGMDQDNFEEGRVSVTERLAAEALIVDVDGYEGPLDLLLTLGPRPIFKMKRLSSRPTHERPGRGHMFRRRKLSISPLR